MAKKFYLILTILAIPLIFVACGDKEEVETAPPPRPKTVIKEPGVIRNQLLGIRRDHKDGDIELVLASGFVLEVDKKSGKLEVETIRGDDLGEIATVYENGRGGYDVALEEDPSVVFIRNAEVKPDYEDGDVEVTLSDGAFGYVLEIDRGDEDERPGSMEVEDKFGKDLFKANPVTVLSSYNRQYPKRQGSLDDRIKRSYGFTWVNNPKKRVKAKKYKTYKLPKKTGFTTTIPMKTIVKKPSVIKTPQKAGKNLVPKNGSTTTIRFLKGYYKTESATSNSKSGTSVKPKSSTTTSIKINIKIKSSNTSTRVRSTTKRIK